jgi:HK97 family phage portal protein
LKCWRGEGATRTQDTTIWQARLFKNRPNDDQTRFGFWETIGESLSWRNNAYIWKNVDPITMRVVEMYALHPDQVQCSGDDEYKVTVRTGYPDPVGAGAGHEYTVDTSTILHICGHGSGGKYEAPSPIVVFRDALAGPISRQRHEERMWRKGASLQLGVEFPADQTVDQVKSWREQWNQVMTGTEGETTAVVGGGATIKPIGMTAADAQFVQMANLTVSDASLIMGVPVNLLLPSASGERAPNLEQELQMFQRFGMGPELERIESALGEDEELFGSSTAYPAFDADAFVRGDLNTEAAILQGRVQAGILTPDEARHILGYDPLPNGVGEIPQITPVGGAPNKQPGISAADVSL